MAPILAVIAKYGGHVRQLLLMSGIELRSLPDILSSRVEYTKKCLTRKTIVATMPSGYLPVIRWEKCLTGAQNVRQNAEGLPDKITPEIILAITVLDLF